MTTVNSVLGPISSDDLGFTLMHEHVMVSAPAMFRTYPDLFGPEDREARAIDTFKKVKAEGIDTIVDATTYDLGRDPELLCAVAAGSGLNIINVTGWWLDVPRFRGTGIKAGILKCAADFEGVTVDLELMARAAARAQIETGIPLMVHSYPTGHVARRQIEIFREEGVDLTRVKIDHSNDTTDIEYLRWILDQGCYLGLDRYPGRLVSPEARTATMKTLIDEGYGEKLCPSHDCICLHIHKERPDGTIPDEHDFFRSNVDQYLYIHRHVIPDLVEMGVSDATVRSLFVDNPRRFFAGA